MILGIAAFVIPCLVAALRDALTEAFKAIFQAVLAPFAEAAEAIGSRRRPHNERPRVVGAGQAPPGASLTSAAQVISRGAEALVLTAFWVTMFITEIFLNALRFIGVFGMDPGDERIRMLTENADLLSGATLACMAATYGMFVFDTMRSSDAAFFKIGDATRLGRAVRALAVVGFLASVVLAAVFFGSAQLQAIYRDQGVTTLFIYSSITFSVLFGALLMGALAISGVAVPQVLAGAVFIVAASLQILFATTAKVIEAAGQVVGVAIDVVATVGDVEVTTTTKVWNAAVDLVAAEPGESKRGIVRNLKIGDSGSGQEEDTDPGGDGTNLTTLPPPVSDADDGENENTS